MAKQKKQVQNGIHFEDSISILSIGKKSNSFIWLFIQFLLIFIGVYSAVFCFADSLPITFHKGVIIIGILLFSLHFFLILHFNTYRQLLLILSFGCFVALSVCFFQEILNGFFYVEKAYLNELNHYIGLSLYGPTPSLDELLCTNYFLLMVSYLLSLFLSFAVIRGSFRSLYLMISLLLVALGFFIGKMPPDLPFFLYIIQLVVFYVMELIPFRITKKMVHEIEENKASRYSFRYLGRIKVGCFCAIMLMCMFLIMRFIITPERYEDIFRQKIQPLKNQIQTSLMELSTDKIWRNLEELLSKIDLSEGSIFGYSWGSKSSGALDGGSLSKDGKVEFDNKTVLTVTVPNYGEKIYLKGYAGSNYTGDKWYGLESSEKERYLELVDTYGNGEVNAINQTTKAIELPGIWGPIRSSTSMGYTKFQKVNYEVTYHGANRNFLYSPYPITDDILDNMEQSDDLFVFPKSSKDSYQLQFYAIDKKSAIDLSNRFGGQDFYNFSENSNQRMWDVYREFELQYRDFVYDVYTKLPNNGLERLRSLEITNETDVFQKVEAVVSYLEQHTNYTLEPGELPNGEDFVEYFLFENHKGYCAHYASSAVLLLRNLGVPARYVEGYLVSKQDIESAVNFDDSKADVKVDVKDSSAHAWVEIYLDGYGWYPVEVTSGYNDISSLLDPFVTKEPEQQEPSVSSKPTKAAEPTIQPLPSESVPSKIPTTEIVPDSNVPVKYKTNVALTFIPVITILLLAVVFILARRNIILNRRNKLREQESMSRRVLLQYAQLEKMLKYLNLQYAPGNSYEAFAQETEEFLKNRFETYETSFLQIMEIALKARFYCIEILEEDFEVVENYSDWLRSRIILEAGYLKRWYLKYVNIL